MTHTVQYSSTSTTVALPCYPVPRSQGGAEQNFNSLKTTGPLAGPKSGRPEPRFWVLGRIDEMLGARVRRSEILEIFCGPQKKCNFWIRQCILRWEGALSTATTYTKIPGWACLFKNTKNLDSHGLTGWPKNYNFSTCRCGRELVISVPQLRSFAGGNIRGARSRLRGAGGVTGARGSEKTKIPLFGARPYHSAMSSPR